MTINHNFFATLMARGFSEPDKPFLTLSACHSWSSEQNWTYGDIDGLSQRIAGLFVIAGLRAGDRICVQVEKSAENVALYLAALRSGLVYTPLNTAYTADEISYFLQDCRPTAFICDPVKEQPLTPHAIKAGVQQVFTLGSDGEGSLLNGANSAHPLSEVAIRHSDDLAAILYTSGTTGRSKGAMLSHENLSSNAIALNAAWGFEPNDILLHALPIFHIHGLFIALHTAMLNGSEVLFLPGFDVEHVKNALSRTTIMMGVPTFYTRLLSDQSFHSDDCDNIRLFISGSAPLTAETHRLFQEKTGHTILERYGMSEAGIITSNPIDGQRIASTVGFPLPAIDIRITDETGQPVARDVVGSVEVKGANVFKGYWDQPEKTASEFHDGWFVTGDLGVCDTHGRLTLVGRSKDLIIAGGYNIYPKEIEDSLETIEEVIECAVIGVPHPDMGEGVIAILVTKKIDNRELKVKNALQALARFKHPRRFFWIEELPRNAMGKIQKQLLRQQYADVFNSA